MMGDKLITNWNFRHTSDGNTNFKNSINEEENLSSGAMHISKRSSSSVTFHTLYLDK